MQSWGHLKNGVDHNGDIVDGLDEWPQKLSETENRSHPGLLCPDDHYFINADLLVVVLLVWKTIFRAVLGSQQYWEEDTDISYILPAPTLPLSMHSPPVINIPHQSGTFVKTGKPTLTHQDHLTPMVYIGVHSSVMHSVGLDKCVVTCSHRYIITQSIFTASVRCLFIPPATPWKPSTNSLSPYYFSRMS